ncbi:MAG: hypothetical protein WCJ35_12090 [Planctomycetota bacterium]
MNSILEQLQKLADADIYTLSDAIDMELQRRDEIFGEASDSARRRALEREQGYRHCNGSTAAPVRATGFGKKLPKRYAA